MNSIERDCIEQMKKEFGNRVVVMYCLTNAYRYLYMIRDKDRESAQEGLKKARSYFLFVVNNIYSYVTGVTAVKLYRCVKEELDRYDSGRTC